LADDFLAVDFLAVLFLADLRAGLLRAVLLRAVDFLAVDFLAVLLRAVDFLAVLLRAVDFLVVRFAVDFFAAGMGVHPLSKFRTPYASGVSVRVRSCPPTPHTARRGAGHS